MVPYFQTALMILVWTLLVLVRISTATAQLVSPPSKALTGSFSDASEEVPVPVKKVELDLLFKQLDSDRFADRQAAMHRLWQLGPDQTAIALYELQKTGTLESRQRAKALLHRFRIGLIPGMDPALARQIANFETGNSAQRVSCIERLFHNGHVGSAMALVRSAEGELSGSGFSSVIYDPQQYMQNWLRTAQWQAIDDFYNDADVTERFMRSAVNYHRIVGSVQTKRKQLEQVTQLTSPEKDVRVLSVEEILGSRPLSREQAYLLGARFDFLERKYADCNKKLEQVNNSETNQFHVHFTNADYQTAAQLVVKLQSRQNRRFVLPEEDVARQLCQALLLGWAGERQRMRELLLAQKPSPEQVYTHTCALMAAADQTLLAAVVDQLRQKDKSSLFELYGDLEQWNLAFAEIEYPVDADLNSRLTWLEKQLKPMRESPLDYRRSNERNMLLNLAESLNGLGLKLQAEEIMTGLAELPSEDETSKEYSRIQLCRRAIGFGMQDWAVQQCFEMRDAISESEMVTILFSDGEHAEFWYRQLVALEPGNEAAIELRPFQSEVDFNRLVALVGRLTRSADTQTLEPSKFMDMEEIERCANLAWAVSRENSYSKVPAIQALITLYWDYDQFDKIVELDSKLSKDLLPVYDQLLIAMAYWQSGSYEVARQRFWNLYWRDPAMGQALVLATLPTGYDLFQFLPDLDGQDLDEIQLLELARPWKLTAQQTQKAMALVETRAALGDTDDIDWTQVADEEIRLTARLHYELGQESTHRRLEWAGIFQRMGADQLAAWQTLEFKVDSIWDDVNQSSISAASSMLGFAEGIGPRTQKMWRAEVITASLLTYPIGKAGVYGTFGVALRGADLQMSLTEDDLASAQQMAKEMLQVHPHDIAVVELLTGYYDARGKIAKGNSIFNRSFEILADVQERYPQSPLLANNLAWMCVQGNRKLKLAERLVVSAMQMEPGTSNYPDTLADILWKQGRISEAQRLNKLSRQLAPTRAYYRRQTEKFMREYQNTYE